MIFYEAPHKLKATLADLYNALGEREIAVCRELTKVHEEVIRTTLSGAIAKYETDKPQGEFVLIIGGAKDDEKPKNYTADDALIAAKSYMAQGMSASNAAKAAALDTGLKKGDIYKMLTQKEESI